ncbi:hypothetical protein ID866_946 [Astraeus odoratus]|nr:hypothetical protein ID866_946 [Astraeus odoratus]
MGLAGRKVKQRIPADPRNLSWADDASRFGQAYLSKFGWDASEGVGLGASGEGMTSHLKVSQKLDMLGIGAAHQRDPHGIAWKQNKDFEALLKRLNEGAGDEKGDGNEGGGVVKEGGFVLAMEDAGKEKNTLEVNDEDSKSSKTKDTKRKRKHTDVAKGENPRKKKKQKRSEEPSAKPEEKEENSEQPNSKHKTQERREKPSSKLDDETGYSSSSRDTPTSAPAEETMTNPQPKIIRGRPMAHRARIQAAKRLATKSAAAISEILGIAPSSSAPLSSMTTPLDLSPAVTPQLTSEDAPTSIEKLTTSTKSLGDYFKEKLSAKKSAGSFAPSPAPTPVSRVDCLDEDYDIPRGGLGLSRPAFSDTRADQPQRQGLAFVASSLSTFMSALPTSSSKSVVAPVDQEEPESSTVNAPSEGVDCKNQNIHEDKEGEQRRGKGGKSREKVVEEEATLKGDKKRKKKRKAIEDCIEEVQVQALDDALGSVEDTKVEKKKRKKDKEKQAKGAVAYEDGKHNGGKERKKRKKDNLAERKEVGDSEPLSHVLLHPPSPTPTADPPKSQKSKVKKKDKRED